MKYAFIYILLTICTSQAFPQAESDPNNYLKDNAIDLRTQTILIEKPVVGFTVIHGNRKAEEAELTMINAVLEKTDTLRYFPEIDAAMAHYFNKYLRNGDEKLLKDLILTYRERVPQEASI